MSIGPYQVLTKLDAGGMGEVYRVRDTRLKRTWVEELRATSREPG